MNSKNKLWIGVLFMLTGWFFGLIAGLLLYKPESEERENFIKGCKIGAWIDVLLILFAGIFVPILVCVIL